MRALHIRIITCVALCFALFLFAPKVDALMWNLDLQTEAQIFTGVDYKEFTGSFTNTDGRAYFATQFDNVFENTNNYKFAVFSIMSLSYYSTTGVITPNYAQVTPGGSTTHLFDDYTQTDIYLSTQRIILYGDYGGAWSNCELQNNYLVCPINPGQKYNRLAFWFESSSFVSLNYRIAFAPTVQLYNPYGVSSSDIQNQTDAIQNSDAPSDATYNNDYSTNSFDAASNSVNQHTDINVSSLNLNTSGYSSAWSWLWSLSESFISNVKVFGAYIFMLTLGFIALVLGR